MTFDDSELTVAIPTIVKELLYKLPEYQGPVINVDTFIDQLRKSILPAQPSSVDVSKVSSGSYTEAADGGECDVNDSESRRDDIFRKRQRARILGF